MRVSFTLSGGLALLCLACAFALAFNFPALTGRVVDQAEVISQESRADIIAKSQALEQKSGIQLVVATVKSLEGGDIETYANELFRTWKLGQEQKNNGILLLVAPNEHKVRIEVGYGLEGTLTDALSSVIISTAIIPQFKSGDFSRGIDRGVDGIISVLKGDSADWQPQPQSLLRNDEPGALNTLLPILGFFAVALILWLIISGIARLVSGSSGHYVTRGGKQVFVRERRSPSRSSSSWSSSDSDSSSSGSSDSDFSGGGGSSGGGGASGSW
ncbi:MAG: TPM domain-containing protein [Xanthobacteraceae bacterium]|jgi:uncharacterized protein